MSTVIVDEMGGQNVEFVFDRIDEIRNGISLTNYTTIRVDYSNINIAATWTMLIDTDGAEFTNQVGDVMDLEVVRITADCATCAGHAWYWQAANKALSLPSNVRPYDLLETACGAPGPGDNYQDNTEFIRSAIQGVHTVTLSYDCGKNPGFEIYNYPSGHYTVTVWATVIVDHF